MLIVKKIDSELKMSKKHDDYFWRNGRRRKHSPATNLTEVRRSKIEIMKEYL